LLIRHYAITTSSRPLNIRSTICHEQNFIESILEGAFALALTMRFKTNAIY